MKDKNIARLRRAKRTRMKIRELGAIRLCVHRTPRHIYAQLTTAAGDTVLATASTVETELRSAQGGNIEAAANVASLLQSEQRPRVTPRRSEEHTSELQSRFDLVCRLLLEKKNRRTPWLSPI